MLVEKRNFQGGMNSDLSPRLLPDTDCLNIMNGRMGVTKYGRAGRLENIPGTTQVSQQVYPPYGTHQTIGSCPDLENMRLLFFNYNTFSDHGIYCYEPLNNTIYAVLYDSQVIGGLGFSRNSLIHSCRVQNGNLYWCDSTNNEPRRININAGIEMNHNGTFPNVTRYEYPMTQSVIRWIRRQPGFPLSVAKDNDPSFANNFIKNEAFLMQWRYIYRDYETSTLSSFSGLMNFNLASDDDNFIAITAPLEEQIDQDVLQVDYVVKYLNGNKSFITKSWNKNIAADLAEINAHNAGATALTFNFYNDIIGIALDDAYSVKPFDSLPVYAQTIEMARFRAFMGNYTIGYDTPTTTSLSAEFVTDTQGSGASGTTGILGYYSSPFVITPIFFIVITQTVGFDGYYAQPDSGNNNPGTLAWGGLVFIGTTQDSITTYYGIGPSTVVFFYPQLPAFVVTLTGAPFVTNLSSSVIYKSDASYKIATEFLDHAGRKCGVVTNDNQIYTTPDRQYSTVSFARALNWSLSNTNAVSEIPVWASYYSILITKCIRTRYFLQARVKNLTYATKDSDGLYVFNSAAYSTTLNGVAIDITRLNGFGMGYNFTEGDLLKLYKGTDVYNLSITGQDGDWIICELENIGTIGNTATPYITALFEIYTPYKTSLSEPYYEVSQIFSINNAGTSSREYSLLNGSIGGDITLLNRNDGVFDYLTENMSPNDKFYKIWNTNSGRPNFIDTIGQVVKQSSIAFSNTFISGTKVNGLSTFDALDTKDIQCGTITKLQVANKIAEDQGDVMLAICETETASLYLGEVQLVGQQGNAFVAQALGVIGTVNVLKGSLGTTRPESVTEYLGLVFGIDLNKGTFWQYSQAGLEPVSRYKMSRFFKNYCDGYLAANTNNLDNINGFHHIRGSINPFHKEAQIILPALIYENYAETLPSYTSVPSYASSIVNRFDVYDQLQKTMSFSYEENKWGSNYEWVAEWQDYLQNTSYGFKNGNLYIFDSNTTNWNTVFGVEYPVRICCTGNLNPSSIKDLFNIAIEGDGTTPNYTVALTAVPNQQITDLSSTDAINGQPIWTVNESVCEAAFLADRLSPNATGTAEEKLFKGDVLKDFAIFVMCEWQVYDRLLYIQFINIGYDQSRGQSNVTNVINK